jgi:oxygen-independent coproporphyrinogen-3 oxidase
MNKWNSIQGIYIHIPFCLQKCAYCDFASFPRQTDEIMKQYTKRLCQEITDYSGALPVHPQATIYFGGGTPSVLPVKYMREIVDALKAKGLWQAPAEATLEANPGTLSPEKLLAIKELGFDRLSMGIQSLQDKELQLMGRIHNSREALQAIEEAGEAGFARISGDLIYGYPTQTKNTIEVSLEGLVKAGLQHISVYGLSVENGTPLAAQIAKGAVKLPTEDEAGDMYDLVNAYLPTHGLHRYEISNYAVPGQESKHNLVYWHYYPYLGFGLNATGFDGQARFTNVRTLKEYLAGTKATKEELPLATRISECIFMGLRLTKGINIEEIEKRYDFNFLERYGQVIEETTEEGLLTVQQGKDIALTERGMALGNLVFEKFL